MGYKNLKSCIDDLEKKGDLIRISEEVDPYLEMSAIQLRVFKNSGKAVFFEKIKGSPFPAVSNLFGTLDRSKFMFRDTLKSVKDLVKFKADPLSFFKKPIQNLSSLFAARTAIQRK